MRASTIVQHVKRAPSTATARTTHPGRRTKLLLAIPLGLSLLFATIGATIAAPIRAQLPSDASTDPAATTGYLEGIDISHWQNTIDWKKVAAAGKRFAIMKATQDTDYKDPRYATNRSGAAAAGIPTTAYHFAEPDASPNDAVLQADHFVNTAKLGAGDLVPALDLEMSGGLGTVALTKWVKTWLDRVKARLDIAPMIYTSPAFWKKYMADTRTIADAGYSVLWIAHWGVSTPTLPAANWGGRGWTFWQYSNCGTVPGISGCVDLDRFNGTDLKRVTYDPGFRLTLASATRSAKQGAAASFAVGISRTSFKDSVAMSVSGLPAGAKAVFNPSSTTGTSSTLTVTTAKTSPITPTGTYPLTVTGSGGGMTRSVRANLVVTDGIGPALAEPRSRLFTGVVLGSTTTPVRTTWSGTDPSGISSYRVQRQVNGGAWSTILGPTTATGVSQSLTVGSTVRYRVNGTDKRGNVSSWKYSASIQPLVTQQHHTSVTYAGGWTSVSSSTASGGSMKYATATGASASFTFTGSSIAWVAHKGPSRGSASVYVDGVYIGGVSLYASSFKAKSIVFTKWWTTSGTHTIKVVARGTAGHPRIDIDAFVRLKRL